MNYRIPVYRAEREAGLAESIQANASIAYYSRVEPLDLESTVARRLDKAIAATKDFDLFHTKDILASTGWNKNDDVFDIQETWAARFTPKNKPFNFEHKQSDIIGHIITSLAVNDDMEELSDDLSIEDLPAKFHILNASVIYRNIGDEDRVALIEKTIAEILAGEWFVSMECFFHGFDYGVMAPDGSQAIIPRNQETAFFTKHLRAYGGTGLYLDEDTGSEYKLGRVPRNIMFCGKGLVKRPANPDSVIILADDTLAFASTIADLGYIKANSTQLEESVPMSEEIKVNPEVVERDKKIEELTAQLEAIKETSATLTKRTEDAEAALEAAQTELEEIKSEQRKSARLATLTEKGADSETASKLVEKFMSLSDEAFAETVEILAAAWKTTPKSKVEAEKTVIDEATPEPDAALASTGEGSAEVTRAAASEYFSNFLFMNR